ncbi:cupin domain-containing protein [Streptomyces roseofulvus]|uniref:Cupin domain-containing protein n=2 Tax=Streptomyces TaxID=1883 RepID=A0ABU4KD49_9ACTN|nr:cupin domain-containing protein [Streptomyces roseolus]MDX2295708.1 cupin domain-containing protein [Streptomyces roseolus]
MSYPDPASYPDARYFGDEGEISARFRPADTPPDYVATGVAPAAYHYLSTTLSTQGEYGLYRVDMGPESAGPATHFHKAMSEAFFVLSGTIRLFDGERWVDARSGDHLYVPVGGLHAFRNESGEPASMLMLFAPGAPREEYFERIGDLAAMSEQDRAAFQVKHDSFFV